MWLSQKETWKCSNGAAEMNIIDTNAHDYGIFCVLSYRVCG